MRCDHESFHYERLTSDDENFQFSGAIFYRHLPSKLILVSWVEFRNTLNREISLMRLPYSTVFQKAPKKHIQEPSKKNGDFHELPTKIRNLQVLSTEISKRRLEMFWMNLRQTTILQWGWQQRITILREKQHMQ